MDIVAKNCRKFCSFCAKMQLVFYALDVVLLCPPLASLPSRMILDNKVQQKCTILMIITKNDVPKMQLHWTTKKSHPCFTLKAKILKWSNFR